MRLTEKEYLQINQALFSLVNAYQRRAELEVANIDLRLSVPERAVIMVLGLLAPINLRALAEAMQLSPGPVSLTVQKLVEKQIIQKEQDQTDRRNWWIKLTETGMNEYTRTNQGAAAYTSEFLNGLTETDQRTLHDLLLKVSAKLGYGWQTR
jgi:DNA-binding MarR family transcriptional regulator